MKSSVYVLYLQFDKKLDENYLKLSQKFLEFGMILVPISVEEFKLLNVANHEYVLAVVRDMQSFKIYMNLLTRYLNYMMRTGKVTLFELNSFHCNHDTKFLRDKKVIQERLPVSLFKLVDIVGRKIYHDITSGSKRWPGGRRAKLPTV